MCMIFMIVFFSNNLLEFSDEISFPGLSEANFSLIVTNGGFQVENKLLGGQLLRIDLADFSFQLIDLLDF